jgi:PAS domain S-box-containing protein
MRWCLAFLCGSLLSNTVLCADPLPQKNVLVLQGQRSDLPGLQLVGESLRKTFDREPGMRIDVFIEYLDFARFPRQNHDSILLRYLKDRYADRRIDLVIPIFGPALEFTLDHRQDLFPDQPIVFCFVDEREAPPSALPQGVMGLYLRYDFERTLQLAMSLQPEAKEIVLITGTSDFDLYWAEQARKAAAAYAGRIPNRTLSGTAEEMIAATRALPKDTITLFVSVYQDASGHGLVPVDVAAELAASSNAPVYGTRSNWIDRGLIGGAVFEHAEHGRITANLALSALKGGTTAKNGRSELQPSPLVVNWRALTKWGIPPNRIPAEAEARFRPPPFWRQYRNTTLGVLAILVVQGGLIAALLVHRSRLRKSEQELDNRLDFETQIANAAANLIDLPPDRVDQKVEDVLREAIDAMDLDRGILFEYVHNQALWRITHCVCSDCGAIVRCEMPFAETPWLHNKLKDGQSLVVKDIELDLPPEAKADRELLRQRGVKSSVIFPISFSNDDIRGVAFDATRRKVTWPQDQLQRLRLVGEIVHSALAGKRSDEALKASEERYREVVESQTELVCRYLPDSTLTFVNEAYCRCFNKSREELIGIQFLTLIPEPARDLMRQRIASLSNSCMEMTNEHEVILPDGTIGWQQWTDYAFLDGKGNVIELQAIGRDITVRRRAELALLESKQRMNLAAEAAHLGYWELDLATGNLWLSDIARTLFGFGPDERATYEACLARVVPEDRNFVTSVLERARRDTGDLILECRVQVTGQPLHWLSTRGRFRTNEESGFHQVFGIAMDITAQKEADLRLQEQLAELSHLSRLAAVGELTASIAHEVNQPLAAMLSNTETVEILLNAPNPSLATVREILADLRADNDRASSVIRSLRNLLRKRPLEMAPIHVNSMIHEARHFVSFDARRRGVEILEDLAPGLPPVRGDKLHLQQVLLNLIINGMDAMTDIPECRRRISLESRSSENGTISISVRDNGHGIPPDRFPQLFASFFTTKTNGVGLGLSIARSIIDAHHGHIWAENCPEGGAAFHVSLKADLK